MEAGAALVVYLVILVIVFLIARYSGIRIFSSLALGILVAMIVMSIVYTPLKAYNDAGDNAKLYAGVMLISSLILIIYILVMAVRDTENGVYPWANLTKPVVAAPATGGYTPIPANP